MLLMHGVVTAAVVFGQAGDSRLPGLAGHSLPEILDLVAR
jgi:hypothetical protein